MHIINEEMLQFHNDLTLTEINLIPFAMKKKKKTSSELLPEALRHTLLSYSSYFLSQIQSRQMRHKYFSCENIDINTHLEV